MAFARFVVAALLVTAGALKRGRLVEKGATPKVIWGIESNSIAAYEKIVETQLATWAKHVPRENLVIVGGKFDDGASAAISQEPMKCDDSGRGLPCKEALLVDRGIERARSLGADWLMVGQEDKYIWRANVERALSNYDPAEPLVLGSFGCGQSWAFHKDSKNATLPMPRGWVDPSKSCKAVNENGGLCGGPVYFLSRGALERVKKQGQTSNEFISEFVSGGGAETHANSDQLASCLYYARGIPMRKEYRLEAGNVDFSTMDEVGHFRNRSGLTSAHINVPKDSIPSALQELHRATEGF
jgi:hypothetical protein